MTITIWLSLFTICILGAMSPGPSLAMVAKHSLTGGRGNGLATAWAHAGYWCLCVRNFDWFGCGPSQSPRPSKRLAIVVRGI